MKDKIKSKAYTLKSCNDKESKKFGRILLKNIQNFRCYYCLDTGRTWRVRKNQFVVRADGRGSYDIMRCRYCNDGGWDKCSFVNDVKINNIRVFKIDNTNVQDRINELKNIYKDKLNEPEEEWRLYEKKEISQKTVESELNVNIQKLSNLVFTSIKLYAGDLTSIANLAKELTINISSTFTKENDSTEIIRKEKNDSNEDVYFLIKIKKTLKNRTVIGNLFKKKKFTFLVKYLLLIPDNDIANNRCIELMNNNIDNKLDEFDF